ncbi:MAG: cell division protein FtsZ [Paludibacteraceae bacterium]|nr:cell division protein FtsZ [Paludibacteraceae bacterium]
MSDSISQWTPIELDELPAEETIIKVIGVGGGGSNAVNYIYNKQIEGVGCYAVNTDAKALAMLNMPNKLAIARHGSGANPDVSRKAAEEHEEEIRNILRGAEMVFITAGMGKGTGTGASPIVARIAKEMGILTIGVVTIPFKFEGKVFVHRAIDGLEGLRQNVDSLLIIANEQIKSIYGSYKVSQAFGKANDVISTAIQGITGAVTSTQGICTDMEDMRTTLKSGQNIMMGVGIADGENRAILAIRSALESPLLVNNSIEGGHRIILNYAMSHEYEMTIEEMEIINDELKNKIGYYGDQIWGTMFDESLESKLKVTIVVTGIQSVSNDDLIAMTLGDEQQPMQPTKVEPQPVVLTTPEVTHTIVEPVNNFQPVAPAVNTNIQPEVASQPIAVETMTAPKEEPRTLSLSDFDSNDFLSTLENESPNWGFQNNSSSSTAYISGDRDNPIVHNDFLNNNVD